MNLLARIGWVGEVLCAPPIAIIAFNRPAYLGQLLTSLAAQRPAIDPRRVHLLQDGAVNRYSGIRRAEDSDIAASLALFRERFPRGHVHASPDNIGVAENILRAERLFFEDLRAPVGYFFEEDLVLSPHYDAALDLMRLRALRADRLLQRQRRASRQPRTGAGQCAQADVHGRPYGICAQAQPLASLASLPARLLPPDRRPRLPNASARRTQGAVSVLGKIADASKRKPGRGQRFCNPPHGPVARDLLPGFLPLHGRLGHALHARQIPATRLQRDRRLPGAIGRARSAPRGDRAADRRTLGARARDLGKVYEDQIAALGRANGGPA